MKTQTALRWGLLEGKYRLTFPQWLLTNIPTELLTALLAFSFGLTLKAHTNFKNTLIFNILIFTVITAFLYLSEYLEISPHGIYGLRAGFTIKIGMAASKAGSHFYKWEEMYHVKRGFFLSSGILFVHCKFKRVMMIPLYLKENHGFLDIINRAAPDGNPVKDYFVSSRSTATPDGKQAES